MSDLFNSTRYLISLDRTNLDPNTSAQNRYIYDFPSTAKFKNTKIALTTANIWFSFFNITEALGNNTFSIQHPEGASTTTLNITIPDGYYTISGINAFIQSELVDNGLYLVNGDGDFVYYVELLDNLSRYKVQFNAYEIPTSLPAGFTNPASYSFPTSANLTPTITFPENFATYVGFTSGTYPTSVSASGADYSVLGDRTPQQDNTTTIKIACNLVSNAYVNPSDTLYSFSPASFSFGQLITEKPVELIWIDVTDGYYSRIITEVRNQSNEAIVLNDPDNLFELVFAVKKDE